jgi:phage terminase small subunit
MGLRGPARNPDSRRGRAEARKAQKLQESITAAAILPDESVIDASVAPAYLSPAMQAFWRRVAGGLKIHQLAILKNACESYDRGQEARVRIAVDGVMVDQRRHPLVDVEAESRNFFSRAVAQLRLDVPSVSSECTTFLPRI